MLEIVPQHTYMSKDGIPVYKSGEWIGSKPNHFVGSKLILKPIQKPEGPFKLGHSVHFPQRYSEEYKFKPHRKKLYPIDHEDIYKPSKRIVQPVYTEPNVYPPHFYENPPQNQLNSNFIHPLFPRKIRMIKSKDNTSSVDDKEYTIEEKMNRKKRVYSLFDQRNHLINHFPGDKPYKIVENSVNFFKEGGLIAGSTNRIKYNKSMKKGEDNFYQTLDLRIKILDKKKTWDYKVNEENMIKDKNYVLSLNNWEKNTFEEEKKDPSAK